MKKEKYSWHEFRGKESGMPVWHYVENTYGEIVATLSYSDWQGIWYLTIPSRTDEKSFISEKAGKEWVEEFFASVPQERFID